jgi:uncharacterized membrane protein
VRQRLNTLILGGGMLIAWTAIALDAAPSVFSAVFLAAFLLLVPGYLIYRLIARNGVSHGAWGDFAYIVAFSSLYLMLIGLIMSVVMPPLGLARPLMLLPMTIAITSTTGVLMGLVARQKRPLLSLPTWNIRGWVGALMAFGALLPLGAIGGAVILNNGGGGWLALATLAAAGLYAAIIAWWHRDKLEPLYPLAVYMISAALLLANSMRGWFITGHDVLQEYQVFQLTAAHGAWSMSVLENAYTACLSITILPTILANLTGIPDAYVSSFFSLSLRLCLQYFM